MNKSRKKFEIIFSLLHLKTQECVRVKTHTPKKYEVRTSAYDIIHFFIFFYYSLLKNHIFIKNIFFFIFNTPFSIIYFFCSSGFNISYPILFYTHHHLLKNIRTRIVYFFSLSLCLYLEFIVLTISFNSLSCDTNCFCKYSRRLFKLTLS